jgi:ferredoxin
MCDFCLKHGEGKKWYLQARNYSEDLLSDVRRRRAVTEFFSGSESAVAVPGRRMGRLLGRMPPFVRRAAMSWKGWRAKKLHFGQVLPLEDVREILGFVNSIVRLPCICRHVTLGREARYCYGVSMGPGGGAFGDLVRGMDDSFMGGPDTAAFEELTPSQALAAFAEHETEALCHTVWTFMTPFIGGICNCDRSDCMAMRATLRHGPKVMFRAEYLATVDPEACTGCRSCMRVCQFGALGYSAATRKALVESTACYGCGVCRSACGSDAISLRPRAEVSAAAHLW